MCLRAFQVKTRPTQTRSLTIWRVPMPSRYAFPLSEEYTLSKHVYYLDDQQTNEKMSSSKSRYPYMKFELRVCRKVETYVYKVLLPVFAITSFASCTFLADASTSITDRLSATLVAVLSVVGTPRDAACATSVLGRGGQAGRAAHTGLIQLQLMFQTILLQPCPDHNPSPAPLQASRTM